MAFVPNFCERIREPRQGCLSVQKRRNLPRLLAHQVELVELVKVLKTSNFVDLVEAVKAYC